jgi:hypothetical protein
MATGIAPGEDALVDEAAFNIESAVTAGSGDPNLLGRRKRTRESVHL